MMNRIGYGLLVGVALVTPSCSLIRRSQGKTPPPVIAAPPTKPPVLVENPQVPPPKVEQTEAPRIGPPVATQIPAKPPAPKPVKRPPRRAPAPVRAQVPPPPVAEIPATVVAPDPALVLAPILSAAQQEAFNKAIDAAVQKTESDLAALATKQLNPAQRANADRAKSFISQAQQTRATDLVTAKTLADRASVLAQSVVSELR